jgi:hypothetical protein
VIDIGCWLSKQINPEMAKEWLTKIDQTDMLGFVAATRPGVFPDELAKGFIDHPVRVVAAGGNRE